MKIDKHLIWFLALFVLMVTVIPTAAAEDTSNTKNVILQMTTTLENSDTQLHFNYAENLGDGRGITFGCIGFCTGTYDGNILIKHYTELNSDNTLAKYIPALNKIDAGSHNAAGGDGSPSTAGLDGLIKDVQNCDDPLFKKAQIDKLDELYYSPAMEIADSIGAKNALTKAFIYDMCVRHGVDDAKQIIRDAGNIGSDESAYLQKLISLRDAKLKQEGLGDVNRDQGYKNVLNSGNVNLNTPFTFVAYGESFTIDGNLDLGGYQQETADEDEDNSTDDVIDETADEDEDNSSDDVIDETTDEDEDNSTDDVTDETEDESSSRDKTKNRYPDRDYRHSYKDHGDSDRDYRHSYKDHGDSDRNYRYSEKTYKKTTGTCAKRYYSSNH